MFRAAILPVGQNHEESHKLFAMAKVCPKNVTREKRERGGVLALNLRESPVLNAHIFSSEEVGEARKIASSISTLGYFEVLLNCIQWFHYIRRTCLVFLFKWPLIYIV